MKIINIQHNYMKIIHIQSEFKTDKLKFDTINKVKALILFFS